MVVSRSLRARPLALLLALGLPIADAGADGFAAGFERRVYSYEVENLADFPDHLVVAYPVVCDWANGKSYAPMVSRHDRHLADLLDYEVLRPGRAYDPPRHCRDTRLYVVDAAGWRVEPVASAPGRGTDEGPLVRVAELDALAVDGRDGFFRKDRRVHALALKLDTDTYVPEGGPLRATHDIFALESSGDKFRMFGRSVTYTYRDGTREIREYTSRRRPPPGGKGDLPPPTPPPTPASPPPASPAPAPKDVPKDSKPRMPRPDLAEPDGPLEPAAPPDEAPPWQWPLAGAALGVAALAALQLRRRR